MKYFVGVDLGSVTDFTVIALVEREEKIVPASVEKRDMEHIETRYLLRHLERIKDLPYPDIVGRIREMFSDPDLKYNGVLLVDITGLGMPVFQMMLKGGLSPTGITITGGETVSKSSGAYNVPKSHLISSMMVLLQSGRFKYSPDLKLGEVFEKEMQAFQLKTNLKTGTTQYEGENEHDDIVIAVCLATWYASQTDPHMSEYFPEAFNEQQEWNPLTHGLG